MKVSGAAGVEETVVEAVPEPTLFTARSCTEYSVPLFKPVTTNGDDVAAGLGIVQSEPPLREYS